MGNVGNLLECSLGFWGISKRVLGNDIILRYQKMFNKIQGNVRKHSGSCSSRFRGNVQEDSWEYSRRLDALQCT